MKFKQIELSDREWMATYLKESAFQGCEYAFGTLFIWQDVYKTEVAEYKGMLLFRSRTSYEKHYVNAFPAGAGDKRAAIEKLLECAKRDGQKLYLRGFTIENAVFLENQFPGKFQIESVRDEWDYLYLKEDLAQLSGKKYHGKRNHIARFMDSQDWHYESMSRDNIDECRKMSKLWYERQKEAGNLEVLGEMPVLERCFDNFEILGFTGGVLYKGEEVVAFTIGEPLTKDTYVVHIEKAFSDIQGAYAMINKQYVLHEMEQYTYVNREEDEGVEGLRKAKESYYPVKMVEKYIAREK